MDQADRPQATEIMEEVTPNGNGPAETSPAEGQTHTAMFRYSRIVHIGEGAEECEKREDGSCEDPNHFHAYLRLPNQFQHKSIRDKANAAKARKIRALRDPESDERVVLDTEIDEVVRLGDKEPLIDTLVAKTFLTDYQRAQMEVQEGDDSEEESPFAHIEEDRERLRALRDMPEEDRPAEEFAELESHDAKYLDAVNTAFEEIQRPEREALEALSIEEIGEQAKEHRIEQVSEIAFQDTYAQWEWYIGTCKLIPPTKPGVPSERYFPTISDMLAAAPEVVVALRETFADLDAEFGRSLKGS